MADLLAGVAPPQLRNVAVSENDREKLRVFVAPWTNWLARWERARIAISSGFSLLNARYRHNSQLGRRYPFYEPIAVTSRVGPADHGFELRPADVAALRNDARPLVAQMHCPMT